MDAPTAEKLARAAWFQFELEPVSQTYGGDWVIFYHEKKQKEDALRAEWEGHGERVLPHNIQISSYDQARAARLLQEEYIQVVQKQDSQAVDFANDILSQLKRGNYEGVAKNCVLYSAGASDRVALTVSYLKTHQDEFHRASAVHDLGRGQFKSLHFEAPDPWAGMPAMVTLGIGSDGYALELWWLGPVMPQANGPRHAKPQAGIKAQGYWQFHRLITPDTPAPLPIE